MKHIRLSQHERDMLLTLKRRTGIRNWNVLCRWAFCLSLADPDAPMAVEIPSDSTVEMTWDVFGGHFSGVYTALLKERCTRNGLGTNQESLDRQFRLHLRRGIDLLVSDSSIADVAGLLSTIDRH